MRKCISQLQSCARPEGRPPSSTSLSHLWTSVPFDVLLEPQWRAHVEVDEEGNDDEDIRCSRLRMGSPLLNPCKKGKLGC